ncbi:MAG: 4Fe-4S dicluster domain-containing protein [Euryarchaeota archaeon]|nr:4Fe-4S dicluster domain-containing protein [Euryarchaeota archaeon]
MLVTSNFDLTVKRVSKHLKDLDCYLLVAPSHGINVWCAAEAGHFSAHSVISVLKTSRIGEKVKHRTLILPQLSAPGMDTEMIKKETGWRCRFGPVYARDIPEYIRRDFKKTDEMRRVKFDLMDRLDAGIGSIFPFYLIIAALLFVFKRAWFQEAAVLGGVLVVLMLALYPYLPGRSGYAKLLSTEVFLGAGLLVHVMTGGSGYGTFIGAMVIAAMIGIDFGGISPIYKSDLDPILDRLGVRGIGPVVFEGRGAIGGKVVLDPEKCIGCALCHDVCPKGVYAMEGKKAVMARGEECVVCRACITQCPVEAISLTS